MSSIIGKWTGDVGIKRVVGIDCLRVKAKHEDYRLERRDTETVLKTESWRDIP